MGEWRDPSTHAWGVSASEETPSLTHFDLLFFQCHICNRGASGDHAQRHGEGGLVLGLREVGGARILPPSLGHLILG